MGTPAWEMVPLFDLPDGPSGDGRRLARALADGLPVDEALALAGYRDREAD